MSEQFDSTQPFRHIRAAQEAASKVTPGNELQEAAAVDIMRLAFEIEVREAFPEETVSQSTEPTV
jgi:hypothetical protein